MNGDGNAEVIAILSSLQKGGSLAVYGLKGGKLALLAKTPFIGQSRRWLNIAGIADYDGKGGQEIALVKTPHIGGELQFWRLQGASLKRIAAANGFSNHFIGSRAQGLSATLDTNGDGRVDLVLPSADRTKLRVMTLAGGGLKELKTIDLGGPVNRQYHPRRGNQTERSCQRRQAFGRCRRALTAARDINLIRLTARPPCFAPPDAPTMRQRSLSKPELPHDPRP